MWIDVVFFFLFLFQYLYHEGLRIIHDILKKIKLVNQPKLWHPLQAGNMTTKNFQIMTGKNIKLEVLSISFKHEI